MDNEAVSWMEALKTMSKATIPVLGYLLLDIYIKEK